MKTRGDEKRERNKNFFKRNALLIIKKMEDLSNTSQNHQLVDEILHSIFFLGEICNPKCTPEEILTDANVLDDLKNRYPRPFQLYSSQLPRRSPMSCVLDMIVKVTGQNNENSIRQWLQQFTGVLKEGGTNQLVSSTICISQANSKKHSVRYYGVSMSTSGPYPGQIMIAASCLSAWNTYVAGAVMSYYPSQRKKSYFDGTFKLPKQVRCEAFSLSENENRTQEMPPCRSCGNLFGLRTRREERNWPYGHCAEAESVSNLLENERGVRVRLRPKKRTEQNRKNAEETVLKKLKHLLEEVKFKWEDQFYEPTERVRGNN